MKFGQILILAAAMIFTASAGQAKVGDAAWAQCVWEKVPAAADNWLTMPAPVWLTKPQEKNAALGHLLAAACSTEPANELKPNRDYNWKQMASALKSAKKSAPASPAGAPVVTLCSNFIDVDGDPELYRIDIVRRNTDGSTLLVFQQHFVTNEGQILKLPQDLRAVPSEKDGKMTNQCKVIANDGSLIDA